MQRAELERWGAGWNGAMESGWMRVKVLVLQAPPLTVAVGVAVAVYGGSLPEVPSATGGSRCRRTLARASRS